VAATGGHELRPDRFTAQHDDFCSGVARIRLSSSRCRHLASGYVRQMGTVSRPDRMRRPISRSAGDQVRCRVRPRWELDAGGGGVRTDEGHGHVGVLRDDRQRDFTRRRTSRGGATPPRAICADAVEKPVSPLAPGSAPASAQVVEMRGLPCRSPETARRRPAERETCPRRGSGQFGSATSSAACAEAQTSERGRRCRPAPASVAADSSWWRAGF